MTIYERVCKPAHNKSSEPTRGGLAALRGEYLARAARLKRYVLENL